MSDAANKTNDCKQRPNIEGAVTMTTVNPGISDNSVDSLNKVQDTFINLMDGLPSIFDSLTTASTATNNSNLTATEGQQDSIDTTVLYLLTSTILCITGGVGAVGNGMAVVSIIRFPQLVRMTYVLIANLSAVGFCNCVFTIPLHVHYMIIKIKSNDDSSNSEAKSNAESSSSDKIPSSFLPWHDDEEGNAMFCAAQAHVNITLLLCTLTNSSAIAVSRYRAVMATHNTRGQPHSRVTITRFVFFLWAFPVLVGLSASPLVGFNPLLCDCYFKDVHVAFWFMTAAITTPALLSVACMLVIYTLIIKKVRAARMKVNALTAVKPTGTSNSENVAGQDIQPTVNRRLTVDSSISTTVLSFDTQSEVHPSPINKTGVVVVTTAAPDADDDVFEDTAMVTLSTTPLAKTSVLTSASQPTTSITSSVEISSRIPASTNSDGISAAGSGTFMSTANVLSRIAAAKRLMKIHTSKISSKVVPAENMPELAPENLILAENMPELAPENFTPAENMSEHAPRKSQAASEIKLLLDRSSPDYLFNLIPSEPSLKSPKNETWAASKSNSNLSDQEPKASTSTQENESMDTGKTSKIQKSTISSRQAVASIAPANLLQPPAPKARAQTLKAKTVNQISLLTPVIELSTEMSRSNAPSSVSSISFVTGDYTQSTTTSQGNIHRPHRHHHHNSEAKQKRRLWKEINLTLHLFLACILFCVLFLPFCLAHLVHHASPVSQQMWLILHTLSLIFTSNTWVAYALLNSEFRQAFKALVTGRRSY